MTVSIFIVAIKRLSRSRKKSSGTNANHGSDAREKKGRNNVYSGKKMKKAKFMVAKNS